MGCMELSHESKQWVVGFDIGKALAKAGTTLARKMDPSVSHDRGVVAGWRLHNGLRLTPLLDTYDDSTWGGPPEPTNLVH